MTTEMERLLDIMARLRNPQGGCPWDVEQTFATITPYTIEEAYEVADAIEQNDMVALKDELGDLLFQVVFHSQMAKELGHFEFADVARAISDKMVRRHPHVFGDAIVQSATEMVGRWEDQKAAERAEKVENASILDGISANLPALTRAIKLQKRAARVGFDWTQAKDILDKAEEEIGEIRAELDQMDPERLKDEVGDLLFVVANLARRLDVDPESALRGANAKFDRRFRRVEALLAERGTRPEDSTLDEMEDMWQQAKREERKQAE